MILRIASFVLRLAAALGILFLLFRNNENLGALEVGTMLFAIIVLASSSVRVRPWAMHERSH